jgi:hypothetical protein
MKKYRFWSLLMLVMATLIMTSCDNEPLEGNFITGEEAQDNSAFTATVNGEPFSASSTTGQLINGVLLLTGTDYFGNIISMVITNIGVCTFDLTQELNPSSFILEAPTESPFEVLSSIGGSGTTVIAAYDSENQTVTGTFNFTAIRQISDGAGGTITESVVISNGILQEIPFTLIDGSLDPYACDVTDPGGGSGGSNNQDPDNTFFALVDGEEFVDISFVSEVLMVGSDEVVKLTATTQTLERVQFFIPINIGAGTFTFSPIFNGSNLFASYTDSDGTESLTSLEGSITFQEYGIITGKMTASFAFTGTDPIGINIEEVMVSEGTFTMDYLPESGIAENTLTAVVDGVSYTPSSMQVLLNPQMDTTYVEIITVNDETNQAISLSFPIDIMPGTYDMSAVVELGTEAVGTYNPAIGDAILYRSQPGTLTITSYQFDNGVIEGQFSFTAFDPNGVGGDVYEITEGFFTLTLP